MRRPACMSACLCNGANMQCNGKKNGASPLVKENEAFRTKLSDKHAHSVDVTMVRSFWAVKTESICVWDK